MTSQVNSKSKRSYRKKNESLAADSESTPDHTSSSSSSSSSSSTSTAVSTEIQSLSSIASSAEESKLHFQLQQTKHLQSLRARAKGVNAVSFSSSSSSLTPSSLKEWHEGESKGEKGLDSTFTASSQPDPTDINPRLQQYIEEKMKQKKSAEGSEKEKEKEGGEEGVAAPGAGGEGSPELLMTPDHRGPSKAAENTNWVTGIVEVELPVEYKLKNIEETEKARRELLQNAQSVSNTTHEDPQASFAAIRYQPERQPKRPVTSERASDDRVMEAFKKRFRK